MARDGGAAVCVAGAVRQHYLGALQYRLANRGQSSLLLRTTPGIDGTAISIAIADNAHWTYGRADSLPESFAGFGDLISDARPDPDFLKAAKKIGLAWLDDQRIEPPHDAHRATAKPSRSTALIVASARAIAGEQERPLTGQFARLPGAPKITSDELLARKQFTLAHGWPMPRQRWERMMAFADRSLIKTSERSREGAG
jgi:hypothetical protein